MQDFILERFQHLDIQDSTITAVASYGTLVLLGTHGGLLFAVNTLTGSSRRLNITYRPVQRIVSEPTATTIYVFDSANVYLVRIKDDIIVSDRTAFPLIHSAVCAAVLDVAGCQTLFMTSKEGFHRRQLQGKKDSILFRGKCSILCSADQLLLLSHGDQYISVYHARTGRFCPIKHGGSVSPLVSFSACTLTSAKDRLRAHSCSFALTDVTFCCFALHAHDVSFMLLCVYHSTPEAALQTPLLQLLALPCEGALHHSLHYLDTYCFAEGRSIHVNFLARNASGKTLLRMLRSELFDPSDLRFVSSQLNFRESTYILRPSALYGREFGREGTHSSDHSQLFMCRVQSYARKRNVLMSAEEIPLISPAYVLVDSVSGQLYAVTEALFHDSFYYKLKGVMNGTSPTAIARTLRESLIDQSLHSGMQQVSFLSFQKNLIFVCLFVSDFVTAASVLADVYLLLDHATVESVIDHLCTCGQVSLLIPLLTDQFTRYVSCWKTMRREQLLGNIVRALLREQRMEMLPFLTVFASLLNIKDTITILEKANQGTDTQVSLDVLKYSSFGGEVVKALILLHRTGGNYPMAFQYARGIYSADKLFVFCVRYQLFDEAIRIVGNNIYSDQSTLTAACSIGAMYDALSGALFTAAAGAETQTYFADISEKVWDIFSSALLSRSSALGNKRSLQANDDCSTMLAFIKTLAGNALTDSFMRAFGQLIQRTSLLRILQTFPGIFSKITDGLWGDRKISLERTRCACTLLCFILQFTLVFYAYNQWFPDLIGILSSLESCRSDDVRAKQDSALHTPLPALLAVAANVISDRQADDTFAGHDTNFRVLRKKLNRSLKKCVADAAPAFHWKDCVFFGVSMEHLDGLNNLLKDLCACMTDDCFAAPSSCYLLFSAMTFLLDTRDTESPNPRRLDSEPSVLACSIFDVVGKVTQTVPQSEIKLTLDALITFVTTMAKHLINKDSENQSAQEFLRVTVLSIMSLIDVLGRGSQNRILRGCLEAICCTERMLHGTNGSESAGKARSRLVALLSCNNQITQFRNAGALTYFTDYLINRVAIVENALFILSHEKSHFFNKTIHMRQQGFRFSRTHCCDRCDDPLMGSYTDICAFQCGHMFHSSCIPCDAVKEATGSVCPLCNKKEE